MRVVFELGPADMKRFDQALRRARAAVRSADESQIIDSARHTLAALPLENAPQYVRDRIGQVQRLIDMLEDEAWALPKALRNEAVSALVYFSDPDDLIPDHIPVIGLLDDAIVLELLIRQERDLLQAYERFCAHRRRLGPCPEELPARTRWCVSVKQKRVRILDALRAKRAAA
jgi:uncharacterized membrane protein YkvA (DUF1232 family)